MQLPALALLLLPLGALALPTLPERPTGTLSARQGLQSEINEFLAYITSHFPVDIPVQAISGLLTDAEAGLALATGAQTTENELSQCGDILIVYARGTTEPGNVGVLAGPPFFDAVRDRLKAEGKGRTLKVQGVNNYGATVPEYLEGGDPAGSQTMADLVTQARSKCPKSHIVMSGYSQGGQLVHNAAKLLPASTTGALSSVVIFGDPDSTQPVQGVPASKTLIICHVGDDICANGDLILLPHLTYAENAEQAATFVVQHAS